MSEYQLLTELGARIKQIRLKQNMTQNELAIECDFEKASMSRIESGQTNLTIRTLHRISKALNVNVAEFFRD